MPRADLGTVTLDYETFGDPDDPTMLMIMGLASHRTWWPPALLEQLVGRGYHLITYDHRDVGPSTVLHEAGGSVEDLLTAFGGGEVEAPYTMADLAEDAVGLLDHLGIEHTHVVGASMGGMIAQTVALAHPDRVLSLTSIMSTTGAPDVGQPTDEAVAALFQPRPTTREAFAEASVETARAMGTRWAFDEDEARQRGLETFDRGYHPEGVIRHTLAIATQPDRTQALGTLDVPTLVIHGTDDILVQPDGGEATAAAVPGARLELIDGMGHDFPEPLRQRIADLIADHADEVRRAAA